MEGLKKKLRDAKYEVGYQLISRPQQFIKRTLERSWVGRLKEYHDLELRIIELEWDADDIYDDPMNGCPGDFAYDYNRKIDRMRQYSDGIGHRLPRWFKEWVYRKVQKASQIRHEQSMNLPWNQGMEINDDEFTGADDEDYYKGWEDEYLPI